MFEVYDKRKLQSLNVDQRRNEGKKREEGAVSSSCVTHLCTVQRGRELELRNWAGHNIRRWGNIVHLGGPRSALFGCARHPHSTLTLRPEVS